ncbi:50S ribosomal protein L3 [Candidatus Pacearchaeota archaeon]|nr:50S ribosomal protein L3 [Candidatus Pacearchaeota archaeon]
MGRKNGPRHGSMQVWPRKRSNDFISRVNWSPIVSNSSKLSNTTSPQKSTILGFIAYKVGMKSAFVKDSTPDSMTKGKRIIVPVTILECPQMKIFSVRVYKNGIVKNEIINDNLSKDLKRIMKMPKKKVDTKAELAKINLEEIDDLRLVVYSEVAKIEIKKSPDLAEIALSGSKQDKLELIKNNISKDLGVTEFFQKGLVDLRGLTKGKGFQGPVKRFGVEFRSHKAEKGQRRVGSIGPWHPTGVPFTVARAGQMGLYSRITYNAHIIASKKIAENPALANMVFDNFGKIKGDYVIVNGSVQGPCKRQILLSAPLRPTKKQSKKQYELVELR